MNLPCPRPNPASRRPLFLAVGVAGALLATGCLRFKAREDPARHFVLSATVAEGQPATNPEPTWALGLGPVTVPAYLQDHRLAVRRGSTEVVYVDHLLWGERLESGIQRALQQNLARLLGTDQIRLSSWRRGSVTCELAVDVQRLDVDEQGSVHFEAVWRLTSPGGSPLLKNGAARLAKTSGPPRSQPDTAVAAMSEAIGDLARQIAPALREVPVPAGRAPVSR